MSNITGVTVVNTWSEEAAAFDRLHPDLQRWLRYEAHTAISAVSLLRQVREYRKQGRFLRPKDFLEFRRRAAIEAYGPDYPVDLIK